MTLPALPATHYNDWRTMIPNTRPDTPNRIESDRFQRIDAWGRVFEKVNYGIKAADVPVSVVRESLPVPAMTDGTRIKIDGRRALALFDRYGSNRAISLMLALNYHELSHVLYSPSPIESALVTRLEYRAKERGLSKSGLFMLCNMVEDQRIETRWATKYRNAGSYFTALVNDLLLKPAMQSAGSDDEALAHAFLYTHGRVYLQPDLRKNFRELFKKRYGDDAAKQIGDLIRRYCRYDLLKSTITQKRAADTVAELYDALTLIGVIPPRDNTGHGNEEPGTPGADKQNPKPGEDNETDDSTEAANEQYDAADEADAEADEESSTCDDGDEDTDEEPGDGKGEADSGGGDQSGSDSEGESAEPADGEADGESGGGSGDSAEDEGETAEPGGTGAGGAAATLADAMHDLADTVDDLLSEGAIREYNEMLAAAADADIASPELDWSSPLEPHRRPTEPECVTERDRCTNALQRMRADTGSVWERRVEYGRKVNIVAFHDRQPWDTNFFDAYDEGREDEFDLEVVVLLDQSGSMVRMMREAEIALWTIRQSFTAVGARVWGIGYASDTTPLFRPGDRDPFGKNICPTYHHSFGGTAPVTALREAERILSRSSAASKLLLTITDGSWEGAYDCDAVISRIGESATTMLAYIDQYAGHYKLQHLETPEGRHYCQHAHAITSPADLVGMMERYVRARLELHG